MTTNQMRPVGDGVEALACGGVADGEAEQEQEGPSCEDAGVEAVDGGEIGVDVEMDGEEELSRVAQPDEGLGEAVVQGGEQRGKEGLRRHSGLEPESETDYDGGG